MLLRHQNTVVCRFDLPWTNGSTLDVSVYDSADLVRNEWRALELISPCSVYQSYDWIANWATQVGTLARIQPRIAIGRLGAETAFILPMGVKQRGPFRVLTWLGDTHTNFHMGLYAPSFLSRLRPSGAGADGQPGSIKIIMDALCKALGKIDLLELCCQPTTWQGHTNPFAMLPRHPSHNHGFSLSLLPSFDEALKRKNGARKRKKLRWQTNQLKDHGGARLIRASDAATIDRAFDAAFAQMAVRFDRAGIWNRFNDAGVQDFMRNLAHEGVGQTKPAMVIYALEIAGTVRATFAGGHQGDQFSGYFISYADDAFSHISPGEMIIHLTVKDCAERGVQQFDFGRGEERYKTSWCDTTVPMFETSLALTPLGRLFTGYERVKLLGKRIVRNNPHLWEMAKRVRKKVYGRV